MFAKLAMLTSDRCDESTYSLSHYITLFLHTPLYTTLNSAFLTPVRSVYSLGMEVITKSWVFIDFLYWQDAQRACDKIDANRMSLLFLYTFWDSTQNCTSLFAGVPGSIPGWGVGEFFRFCQSFTSNSLPFLLSFSSFPTSSFPFPSPFDLSFALKREAQWPIGYGVGLRIKRSSVRIRPWPLRWVLGQGSLLPLSQGEAFTLASISYLAILVKYILAKKKKKKTHSLH